MPDTLHQIDPTAPDRRSPAEKARITGLISEAEFRREDMLLALRTFTDAGRQMIDLAKDVPANAVQRRAMLDKLSDVLGLARDFFSDAEGLLRNDIDDLCGYELLPVDSSELKALSDEVA